MKAQDGIIRSLVDTVRARSFLNDHGPFRPPTVLHIPATPPRNARLGVNQLLRCDINIIRWALQSKNSLWFECDSSIKEGASSRILSSIGIPRLAEVETCNGMPIPSPIMQVGTDFYLGTTSILSAIEKRMGFPSLFPHPKMSSNPTGVFPLYKEAEYRALQMWIDSSLKAVLAFAEHERVSRHYLSYCLKIIDTLFTESTIPKSFGPEGAEDSTGLMWSGLYGSFPTTHMADIYVSNILLSLSEDPEYRKVISDFPQLTAFLKSIQSFFATETLHSFNLRDYEDLLKICKTKYIRNEYGLLNDDLLMKWQANRYDTELSLASGFSISGHYLTETDWDHMLVRQFDFKDQSPTFCTISVNKCLVHTLKRTDSNRENQLISVI